MTTPLLGLFVSAGFLVALSSLFHIEKRRGKRIFEPLRGLFDMFVGKLVSAIDNFFYMLSRDVFRQTVHYFFHTLLSATLAGIESLELRVKGLLQSNRILAKKLNTERTTRNKLDEVAEHKASIALSDDEKREQRLESLEG